MPIRRIAEKTTGLLINIYLLLLLVVLPLYMENGFVLIGDVKYYFFRDRTILFVLLVSICAVFCLKSRDWRWSEVDIAVLSFAAASILSFCLSDDKRTAFWGYDDWYMGLLSQLLFVWIYFAVSRGYEGEKYIWETAGVGAVVVFTLGILNRLGYDPLKIYEGIGGIGIYAVIDDGNWIYEHMLSTIGNENWYCGYASVASGICLYYGYSQSGWKRVIGLTASLITFMTLLTQGSEAAYFIIFILFLLLLIVSLDKREQFLGFLNVLLLLPLSCVLLEIYDLMSTAGLQMNSDSTLESFILFRGWGVILILMAVFRIVEGIRERRGKRDYIREKPLRKAVFCVLICLMACGMVLLVLCQISDKFWIMLGGSELLRFSRSWGSYHGGLWYLSILGWLESGWKEKVFGVGPDCFAVFLYSRFDVADFMAWAGLGETIYANAHNEWLNMLINEGIFGAVSYAAIFVCAFRRIWKNRAANGILLAALLALGGYMINGVFSFQQTISTPLIFAILGMAEAEIRSKTAVRQA
ncbi:MAG: O-antigen ligase family protein [Lachnospiraceae bacterium]|nr:O-antigen ligase family protein [Lachnospiraceae bacterium]